MQRQWWKEGVVYQIYPKSFLDSNGDGIGDLRGIIARLDMLKTLGVDILWLNPIYASPDVDNGYDISDYQAIHPQFGTLADVELLLDEVHRRGMKVIMDLVVNHTSDQHPWFIESRRTKDNPYREYYIWRDGKAGREPNNWGAHFTKSAWTRDEKTDQYYLHTFSPQQPDLNWENPRLREAITQMIRWWLEKGIDGFRLDAISFISKAPGLPDNQDKVSLDNVSQDKVSLDNALLGSQPKGNSPIQEDAYIFSLENMMNGPEYHAYLRELNRNVLGQFDIVTVGECIGLTVESAIDVSAPERKELNMPFLFEHTDSYINSGKDPHKLKEILTRWQVGLHDKAWIGLAFNNHDLPRVVSLFGDDKKYREASAKLFATLLLTLEGTPFLYQGEEIGMTNTSYNRIEEFNDVSALNFYRDKIAEGADPQVVFEQARRISRDSCRSPYQWNAGENAGFSSAKPWLGVNPNYTEVNLENNLNDPNSVFYYYRRMIGLRKQTLALIYGQFVLQDAQRELFVYRRLYENEAYQVVLNMSDQEVRYAVDGKLLIDNYGEPFPWTLHPYEARLYRL